MKRANKRETERWIERDRKRGRERGRRRRRRLSVVSTGQVGSAQVQKLHHSDSVHVWFRKITCSTEQNQDTFCLKKHSALLRPGSFHILASDCVSNNVLV